MAVKPSQNSGMPSILQKWHPKSKCRLFFGDHVFTVFRAFRAS